MNTIKQETSQTFPPLIKGLSTYKLIIPENVEEKIRYLIRKFPHTEWSGVLFCTHEGTFEDNNLTVTCKDIYPMDLGTAGWTEFRMSEDVASYMAENIELFDCDLQLVHSHHSLGAYFSSQDNKMLQQEGNDTNCFVSLVVDTRGTYVARITRKVQTTSEVTIKNLGKSYEFFGEGSKELSHENTETKKVVTKEYIEYFNMEVERHEVPNYLDYLDTRFEEIERKKKENTFSQSAIYSQPYEYSKIRDILNPCDYKNSFNELDLFNKYPKPIISNEDLTEENNTEWTPNAKNIHAAVVHIITCSLIVNPDKIDLRQWTKKHMVKVYKQVFGEDSEEDAKKNTSSAFSEWKDYIIQATIEYFNCDDAPDYLWNNHDLMQSKIASALCDELFDFIGNNVYIKAYYDELCSYIME